MSGCARATSAAEARYRIDAPIAPARAARVVALDDPAAKVVRRVAGVGWASAHFLVCMEGASAHDATSELVLRSIDGWPATLDEELSWADVLVMIATNDDGAVCASALGRACSEHGIMTAGLTLGEGLDAARAAAALRPYARVLLPSASESDLAELLTALRA